MENNLLSIAKGVLHQEAYGITQLAEVLDIEFCNAVELILNTKGRLIVTGIGKPGHIANKIAATMASTGTPALFVHPAEASHGDLGMICREDTILMLSLSGETMELMNIIDYTRRFQINLIAITGNSKSFLAKYANITLLIPTIVEACPNGLAPTTTTTAMLALGDALAVALIHKRRFGEKEFKAFHPGGALGKKLLCAQDLMASGRRLPLVLGNTTMDEALLEMTSKSFGCVGVINNQNQLKGIITDGDLRRHMSSDLLKKCAQDVMTPDPVTIKQEMLAIEIIGLMNSKKITAVFVVDSTLCPIGLIHIHSLLEVGIV